MTQFKKTKQLTISKKKELEEWSKIMKDSNKVEEVAKKIFQVLNTLL